MSHYVYPKGPNEEIHIFGGENVYFVNPVEHFKNKITSIFEQVKFLENSNRYHSILQRLTNKTRARNLAKTLWDEDYQKLSNVPIPEEFKQLLNEKKKQQALLKGVQFNSDLFLALPIYAWLMHKMPFSIINADQLPKEYNDRIRFLYYLVQVSHSEMMVTHNFR